MRSQFLRFSLSMQLCLLALSAAATARAATITVDLPVLAGTLAFDGAPISVPFDAGVQFSSIESVVVRAMVESEEGEVRFITYSGGINSPDQPTIMEQSFAPPLQVILVDAGGKAIGDYAHPLADFGTIWQAEFNGAFYETLWNEYFSHLLDGTGVLRLASRNHFVTLPWTQIEILEPSVLHVSGAQIIITGTLAAVPAPGSAILLLAGGGLLAVVRLWRKGVRRDTRLSA